MSNEAGLYRLIYVSRNAMAGQARQLDEEIGRILASSRRNNARVGVTGALLFSADCFAQALVPTVTEARHTSASDEWTGQPRFVPTGGDSRFNDSGY